MNRRKFLTAAATLPLLGFLKPGVQDTAYAVRERAEEGLTLEKLRRAKEILSDHAVPAGWTNQNTYYGLTMYAQDEVPTVDCSPGSVTNVTPYYRSFEQRSHT